MEKKKYVTYKWEMSTDRPKKVYTLTSEGKALLDYMAGSLRSISKCIGKDGIQIHNEVDQTLKFNVITGSKEKNFLT